MSFFEWQDALLKHPDGRASGGEPCVKCGEPIPPNAHWKQRDRHVCSERCNNNLKRQLKRAIARGDEMPVARPEPMQDPRTVPVPWTFTTLPEPNSRTGTKYSFDGLGPRVGDVVERHGVGVLYGWTPAPQVWVEHAPYGFLTASETVSRYAQWWTCDENRRFRRTCFGLFDPAGRLVTQERDVVLAGRPVRWALEIIRDVTADDLPFDWEAPVCVPADAPHETTIWTLAYQARSERLRRASASAARHARRIRVDVATVETFDPREVFERDGWECMLCHESIDRENVWPDPLSASLDHIQPILAGGEHSRANTQAAHWICNVRKGARWNAADDG